MNNYTPNQGFLMEPIMDGTFDLLGGGGRNSSGGLENYTLNQQFSEEAIMNSELLGWKQQVLRVKELNSKSGILNGFNNEL